MSAEIRSYYDKHTRKFLRFGQHQETRNIHQALWAPGIYSAQDAANWSNQLVLSALQERSSKLGAESVRVLDLGCGVGSSVYYLAERFSGQAEYCGISISPLQIELATAHKARSRAGYCCEFVTGDFLNLPDMPEVSFAFAIEAFLHAQAAQVFFEQAASVLTAGGELLLIDDFLTPRASGALSKREASWLSDFRRGWLAGSLLSVAAVSKLAANVGLRCIEDEELTPMMKLGRPRDKAIGVLRQIAGPLMKRSVYGRSLIGGFAKQQCLKAGLVSYRKLRFVL